MAILALQGSTQEETRVRAEELSSFKGENLRWLLRLLFFFFSFSDSGKNFTAIPFKIKQQPAAVGGES